MRYVVLDTDVASRAIKGKLTDPRPANDSWIAACCLAHDFPLATFKIKDFNDFAEHDSLRLVSS
jgi:predicted nucleic acid-binding protein